MEDRYGGYQRSSGEATRDSSLFHSVFQIKPMIFSHPNQTSCLLSIDSPPNPYAIFVQEIGKLCSLTSNILHDQTMIRISHSTLQPLLCLTLATSTPLCSSPWQMPLSLGISASWGLKCNPASSSPFCVMNTYNIFFTGALTLPNIDGHNVMS